MIVQLLKVRVSLRFGKLNPSRFLLLLHLVISASPTLHQWMLKLPKSLLHLIVTEKWFGPPRVFRFAILSLNIFFVHFPPLAFCRVLFENTASNSEGQAKVVASLGL